MDSLRYKAVTQTCSYEDGRSIVEERVCASELLQGLQYHTEDSLTSHSGAGEDLVPVGLATGMLSIKYFLHFQ